MPDTHHSLCVCVCVGRGALLLDQNFSPFTQLWPIDDKNRPQQCGRHDAHELSIAQPCNRNKSRIDTSAAKAQNKHTEGETNVEANEPAGEASLISRLHTNWTAEHSFEKHHTFSPISYFIVIVVFFDNIWTRSSTLPERHMINQKKKKENRK